MISCDRTSLFPNIEHLNKADNLYPTGNSETRKGVAIEEMQRTEQSADAF